jgi:hypothetical protein
MYRFRNVCDGKYIEYWEKIGIDDLVLNYKILSAGENLLFKNFHKIKPGEWDLIMSTIKQEKSLGVLESAGNYRLDSKYMNEGISSVIKGENISPEVRKNIVNLTKFIETQALKEPVTVYRYEGYYILKQAKLPNGENVGDILQKAEETKNFKVVEKLNKLIKKSEIPVKQGRFMSTAAIKPCEGFKSNVLWELEAPVGTKCIFMEGANVKALNCADACEVTVQRDSQIIIKNIRWDNERNCWYIKGKIHQEGVRAI